VIAIPRPERLGITSPEEDAADTEDALHVAAP
jgi:hypothetical protein